MKVLTIDLGATSGRVMTVTHSNHHLSYEENTRFLNKVKNEKGMLRWDFEYLFNNIKDGIKKALSEHPDIASIGIDTWAVDYGFIKDNNLIENPACYRDTKSFESQKKLLKATPFEKIYSITGIQNLHFNTIYQLYGEDRDFTGLTFLMIPDLIAYFLTGEARLEETNASSTSLYNKKEGRISLELLNAINVPESIFPKMIHPGEIYGFLKDEFYPDGFKGKIPVVAVGTHDTSSAVLGASGKGKFAYISSGTWSLIGTELEEAIITDDSRNANFTNEIGYNSTIRFLKNTMGMFLINEVRNDYESQGTKIPVEDIAKLVGEAKDTHSYLDVNSPVFETPGDMLTKVRDYLNKTKQETPTTPGEMMKMIYKSMALSYKEIISKLEKLANLKINSILVVGGGNQASVLNQYTADACGIEVITGSSEATVLGNALAQLIALGDIKDVIEGRSDIALSITSKTFIPNDNEYWESEYVNYLKSLHK